MLSKKFWIPVVLALIGSTFWSQRIVSEELTNQPEQPIVGQAKGQRPTLPEYPLILTSEELLEYLKTTPPDKIYARTRDMYIENHYYKYPNCTEYEALLVDAERYAEWYIADLELRKEEATVGTKWEKEIQKEILSFDYEAFVKLRESSTDDGKNALVAKYDYWAQKREAMYKRIEEIREQGSTAPKPSHTHQTKDHNSTTEKSINVPESAPESQRNSSDDDIRNAEVQDTPTDVLESMNQSQQGILQAHELPMYPQLFQVKGQIFILPTYPQLLTAEVIKEYLKVTPPRDVLVRLQYMYIARHYNKYPNCTEHKTLLVDAINYAKWYIVYMKRVREYETAQKELEQAEREYKEIVFSMNSLKGHELTKEEKMENIAKMNTARKKSRAADEKRDELKFRDKPKLPPLTHAHTFPIDVYKSALKTPQNPLGDYRHIIDKYAKQHFREYPDCQEYEAIFKDAERVADFYYADRKWIEELQAAYTEVKNLHREDDEQIAYLSSIVNPREGLTDKERAALIAKIEDWQKRYNAANVKYEEIFKRRSFHPKILHTH